MIIPYSNLVDFNKYNYDFIKLFTLIYNNNESALLNSDLINTQVE